MLTISRTPDNEWGIEVLNSTHNHEPSLKASAHPAHRKLTSDEQKLVKSMTDRAAKPRDIILAIKQVNPHTHVTASNVRNQKVKLRKEELAGRTPTQAVLDQWITLDE